MELNKFQRQEIARKIKILGLGHDANIEMGMQYGISLSTTSIIFDSFDKDTDAEDSVALFNYISAKKKNVEIKREDNIVTVNVANCVLFDLFLKV